MAKTITVTGVKASTIALFEGTFALAVGLVVAIMYSLGSTIGVAQSTNSVLLGLSFGLATGVISLIVVPIVYFAIGWLVGYVNGWLFNVVISASGGIDVHTEK